MSDTIFGTNVPVITNGTDGVNYTMGTLFRSSEDGFIFRARWYAPSVTPSIATIRADLWDSDTITSIANVNFTSVTLGAWNEVAFSSPVAIVANKDYLISVTTDRYTATSHYFDDPITSGRLTAPGAAGKFNDLGAGTTPTYPVSTFNAGGYFVDVVFDTSTPGVVWYVYNGSTEVPGTPNVWNGSSEVPVSAYEIAP